MENTVKLLIFNTIAAIVITLLFIAITVIFSGCTSLQTKDDKNFSIDCSDCKVKYNRVNNHDFIRIEEHLK